MDIILPYAKYDSTFERHCAEIENHYSQKLNVLQGSDLWKLMRVSRELTDSELLQFRLDRDKYIVMEDGRKLTITVGGSELAAVAGMEKYRTRDDVVVSKVQALLGIVPESKEDTYNTTWGHLFEPIIKEYAEIRLGTKIYEVNGSLVHPAVANFRYSPDGVGPIMLGDGKVYKALYEFKCPFSRVVTSTIPSHYTPQVLSGICTFDGFLDCGIFVEGNYKIKSLAAICSPNYNASVHMRGTLNGQTGDKRYDGLQVLDAVLICFYSDTDVFESDFDTEDELASFILSLRESTQYRFGKTKYPIFDVGGVDFERFKSFMKLVESSKLTAYYNQSYLAQQELDIEFNPHDQIITFLDWCKANGKYPACLMSASLYKDNICYIPRQMNYVGFWKSILNKFNEDTIKKYNELSKK